MTSLLDRLRAFARSLVGVAEVRQDEFTVLGGDLAGFVELCPEESPPAALLRVSDQDRSGLRSKRGVRKSKRMRWDTVGWQWMDIPLDGSLPEAKLLPLIQGSYQLTVAGLPEYKRADLDLIARQVTGRDLVRELIAREGLTAWQAQLEDCVRPALLLKTTAADDSTLPLGCTKIGGDPDLPGEISWPRHSSGKPLAFLAQINLADAARHGTLDSLPSRGMLYFFSVFGWQEDGGDDVTHPPGPYAPDWTRVDYHPTEEQLQRHPKPTGVSVFPAAAVEFLPILSLPSHHAEPVRAALAMSQDEQERIDMLHGSFELVTMHQLGRPALHQLLGYARYEQDFVPAVAERDLQLILQIASDADCNMQWGDAGFLYFWGSPAEMNQGQFTSVHSDYQCG